MILLIDNFDSFSYNLCQMLGSIDPDIRVVRNNVVTISDIRKMAPSGIVLSPGPGRPEESGICPEVVSKLGGTCPILGVCLGEQAIAVAVAERSVMQNELSTVSNQRSGLTIRACSSKDSRTILK